MNVTYSFKMTKFEDAMSLDGNKSTHWDWDQMAANFLATFSNAFFLNEIMWILILISLKFIPKGPINNVTRLGFL